ncbi:MAG TPA: cellulase family glycosylhydrolase [Chryseosolibacter sp.]|nr:cellulase family glycosylhydrolase [Chryseosolibacter sp.]
MKNPISKFVFSLVMLCLTLSCGDEGDFEKPVPVTAENPRSESRPATNGRTANLGNGVNLQPSYFCSGNQDLGWTLMKQHAKIETVRIELDPTAQAGIDDFVRWIREANANSLSVIATHHDADFNGSPDPNALLSAANWWKANYATLSAAGPFMINLMNEWGDHNVTVKQYADAYNAAIAIVRQVYSGPIICDIPGWGQETHTAADASPLITDQNIIFSAHIYPSAWNSRTGKYVVSSDLDYLGNAGRPVLIGEFGSNMRGSADWSGLVDHAKAKGWTVLGWAWNGDGSRPDKMNMTSPYWGERNACGTKNYTTSSYFNTVYSKL